MCEYFDHYVKYIFNLLLSAFSCYTELVFNQENNQTWGLDVFSGVYRIFSEIDNNELKLLNKMIHYLSFTSSIYDISCS